MEPGVRRQRDRTARRHVHVQKGRIRKAYSVEFKRTVCRLRDENPSCTWENFAELVRLETGHILPLTTVVRTIKERDIWFSAKTLSSCRQRPGKWQELEQVLLRWCTGWVRRHGTLTYAILKEQALVLARRMPEISVDFACSNGWADGFCRRHDLKMRRRCGEGGDANVAAAELGRSAIPYVLQSLGARPKDTFNCDETGIIFTAQPYRTLTPINVQGTKKAMDRVTALMCCNATGTKKLKLLMLGTVHRARAWGRVTATDAWHPHPYVTWKKSPKGWMNREIFNDWLTMVLGDFKMQCRRLFLIMDNYSAHYITLSEAVKFQIRHINVSVIRDRSCIFNLPCLS